MSKRTRDRQPDRDIPVTQIMERLRRKFLGRGIDDENARARAVRVVSRALFTVRARKTWGFIVEDGGQYVLTRIDEK